MNVCGKLCNRLCALPFYHLLPAFIEFLSQHVMHNACNSLTVHFKDWYMIEIFIKWWYRKLAKYRILYKMMFEIRVVTWKSHGKSVVDQNMWELCITSSKLSDKQVTCYYAFYVNSSLYLCFFSQNCHIVYFIFFCQFIHHYFVKFCSSMFLQIENYMWKWTPLSLSNLKSLSHQIYDWKQMSHGFTNAPTRFIISSGVTEQEDAGRI